MFTRFKNFFSRHRNKFITGGILVGGVVLFSKYAQKVKEWQEKEAKEFLERARKQQHYDSIEKTCNLTAMTLASTLKEVIIKLIKSEELIQKLQSGVKNRVEVWEELKILAFSKLVILLYAHAILTVTLRIQLNLIGGYMFRYTTDDSEENKITSNMQEKYLGLCQFFIEEGIHKLCDVIKEKVKVVLEKKSLKEKLSLKDIEQIFWAVQTSISNDDRDPCKSLPDYVLPNDLRRILYVPDLSVFDNIIVETHDILESEEIIHLIKSCISHGFCYVTDKISQYYKENDSLKQKTDFANPVPTTSSSLDANYVLNLNAVTIPMAKIIPLVNGFVQNQTKKDDVPHAWIQQLILMDSLKVMGANIYETFSSKK